MGRNRKNKNVANDKETYSLIETEDDIQEAPEDFLTSDNFCVVQKKKSIKRYINDEDSSEAFHQESSSVKHLNTKEGNNSHMSFWNCRPSTSVTGDLPFFTHINSSFESSKESTLKNSILLSNESSSNIDPKFNTDFTLDCEVLAPDATANQLPMCMSVESNILESTSSVSKVEVIKKKSKKKVHKVKPEEYEVEKILKELGFVEKSNNNEHYKVSKVSGKRMLNSQTLSLEQHESLKHKICINSNFVPDIDAKNVGIIDKIETLEVERNHELKTTSQKRKEKRLKSKLKSCEKCNEGHLEKVPEACELASKDEDGLKENGLKENVFTNCDKETVIKGNEDSEKKSRKRPSKKQLAIIQEALKKAKEEEERLKKEEEAKQRLAEEMEKIRQEKLRLEQEKKEKRKLKEKQRREKMKAEGRLLSKSQKQSRARMEATLAALRQQGIDVPQICDKKTDHHGPRLGSNKNFHRKRLDSCLSVQSTDSAVVVSERQKSESLSSQESSGKDSLLDLPGSFDSTDDSVLPESDRGNFSCSEESDALDDATTFHIISVNKKPIQKMKTVTGKSNYNKAEHPGSKVESTESERSDNNITSTKLRSPVVCVLGHVDTGKTKILDYIRKTHVQDSEAGGITQQIGATMIPRDALKEKCKMVKKFSSVEMKIPGLLVIDTPGHESFSNLRSRGSSVCDIAVLVVDIMHGLEPQTIESINLLKRSKIPFVVALNKVDRIYGWKNNKNEDIENTVKGQSYATQMDFERRCREIILQFASECLNASLFYENKDPKSYVSMVPTSAITGDGMGNILGLIVQLTQSLMQKKLIYSDELEATVLEVKAIPGLGTTIDVILVNGELQEGDTILLAGQEGPIVTQIRSLLMPQSLKELRVKNPYIEYKAIKGAQGVKVTGKDLDKAIAGLPLFVAHNHNMVDVLKEEISHLFGERMNSIKTSERGVYVQASTLGSLEALLDYLSESGIPYFSVKIGPVVKKDVMKASIMLEHDVQYAAILAFDVKVERDAQELADNLGVRIFHADIIYHLYDMYIKFRDDLLLKRHEDIKRLAIFPCKLKILPEFIFSLRDPVSLGVYIEEGILKEGTPLCVPSRNCLDIGIVSSIEVNSIRVGCAKKGENVCIKIDSKPGESSKIYGKHFNHEDLLISHISRQSIDVCKEHFRNDLNSSDWHLIVELKKILHIV